MLHGVGEEVGVNEDGVGRDEGGVVLEEERGGDLWSVVVRLVSEVQNASESEWWGPIHFADDLVAFGFPLGFYLAFVLVLLSVASVSTGVRYRFLLQVEVHVQSCIPLSNDPLDLGRY